MSHDPVSTNVPTVSFASDMEADLHMFSQDADTGIWRVFVISADGREHERLSTDRFDGYWYLADRERCWYIDDVREAMFIEIRRPEMPPARASHPRWTIWQDRYPKGDEPPFALEKWSGPKIRVVDMSVFHRPCW
jgi:hypothetical protein